MNTIMRSLQQLRRYPSAIAGLVIILGLIAVSIYTIIAIPYNEAITLWRGGIGVWDEYPKTARPIWYNWFSLNDLPETVVIDAEDEAAEVKIQAVSEDITEKLFTFNVDYPYDGFPQEVILFLDTQYAEKAPHITLTWFTPDGREINAGSFTAEGDETFRFSQDESLTRRLGGLPAEIGLFADPESETPVALEGTYQLQISAFLFEDEADVEAKFVSYGQVHGLAGTDHRRRDLMIALLWGTPIALAFGLLAAVGTTISTMIIAAVGVWFGGWLDAVIQRITEVNLILPVLPILIMIGTFYSRSLWLMLGVIILLSIFGATIKTYRAIFLQVKESSYIEAARAYGAGNMRIIIQYLVPRILPLLLPQLVVLIPTFVFLEATLALLGLGDPVLPTWGKIIQDASSQGALFNGYYYWIIEPAVLLMMAGLGFALVGFALDRIFNPRLREL